MDDGDGYRLPRGFDSRRSVYSKDIADAYNPCSAYHLRTHYPKYKGCPVCCDANTRSRPHRRRGDLQGLPSHLDLDKFGDLVTMDVITIESKSLSGTLDKWQSLKRTRNCLLI